MYALTSMLRGHIRDILTAPSGVNYHVARVTGHDRGLLGPDQILDQNASSELAEKTISQRYPCLAIYCEKITNEKKQKFSPFDGSARMTVEARVSGDDLQYLEQELGSWVDAITVTLENSSGNWGAGMLYSGRYEVGFSAVRRGGAQFVQSAKVSFDVHFGCGKD